MKLSWMLIAFVCGAVLPFQAGLNSKFGKSIDSPVYAALFSFIIGAISVAVYLQFTEETVTPAGLKSASLVSWLGGGMIGAFFITASMLALPRIGMGLTFGLIVAGQVIVAVLLDHFGILAIQHSVNAWRIAGIVLIIIGVVIVQKF
ncbi:MAG: DMT family transporter [Chitinophagaceae bacterium]